MARNAVNPKSLDGYTRGWKMSAGVESNGLLFLSGMTGVHDDGSVSTDPEQQIRDAFAKVQAALDEAGVTTADIVEMTSFHVGMNDHVDAFRAVRDELVGDPYPAWTAIEVAGFMTPGAIVELRVVADVG